MAKEFFKKLALGVAIALVSTAAIGGLSALTKAIRGDEEESISADSSSAKYCTHTGMVEIPGRMPTCIEAGYTAGSMCATCGGIIEASEPLEALGHLPVPLEAVEPTCSENGLTEGRKCSRCDVVIEAQSYVAAKGHTFEYVPGIEPTCTEVGLSPTSLCTVCDEVLHDQVELPPIHVNENGDEVCDECGVRVELTAIYEAVVGEPVCNNWYRVKVNDPEALLYNYWMGLTFNNTVGSFQVTIGQTFSITASSLYQDTSIVPEAFKVQKLDEGDYMFYLAEGVYAAPETQNGTSGYNDQLTIDSTTVFKSISSFFDIYRMAWTEKPWTVEFLNYDNSVIDTVKVKNLESLTQPANPTRGEDAQYTYEFSHWMAEYAIVDGERLDVSSQNIVWDFTTPVEGDFGLKAVYTAKPKT